MVATSEDLANWARDGFVVKRALFSPAEIAMAAEAMHTDAELGARGFSLDDGHGGRTGIALWNHVGDDTLGLIPRLERMAGMAADLLGGEVYHYHSKITSKAPHGGGTWEWHQDYGYWYKNGCLFPDMLSVAIAIGPQTRENGCLRVLAGSHRCGRVEHYNYSDQTAADVRQVALLQEHLPEVAFEAAPGDAMFFHSNLLHSSSPNVSDIRRDVLLVAHNTRANDPVIPHHHPGYIPLDVVDDGEMLRHGLTVAGSSRVFMDPADDMSIAGFGPPPN